MMRRLPLRFAGPVLIGVAIAALFALQPGRVEGVFPAGLDHFKCYPILAADPPQPADPQVLLRDQFVDVAAPAIPAQVLNPRRFCNPVQKIHAGIVTSIQHPENHLKFYGIQTELRDPIQRVVHVANQFGENQTLDVRGPIALAVPTQKLTPFPLAWTTSCAT